MDRKKFLAERQWLRNQLSGVADFWLKNGMDPVNGGIYTCLDRAGNIYSTDKSVWMQGRCDHSIIQSFRKICFVDDRSSSYVQKNGRRFHFGKLLDVVYDHVQEKRRH